MGKVLKGIAIAAAFIGASFIPGIGQAIQATLLSVGVSVALSTVSGALFGPKSPKSQLGRLNASLDPSTPRKAVFGTTAMNLDIRYIESSGTDQEYYDYIIATSAHKVTSIDEIWFDDKKAWDSTYGTYSPYAGYLTVSLVTEGNASNYTPINGGTKWGSSRRLTGCSYVHIRIKRSGASDKVESPLVNGLPNRITIRGNGALLYDPRQDSTVPGGYGTHRADDQDTWGSYTNQDDCDNPALQLLWWLIGWRINGKLSIGCGVPYQRIDMESFITAANICDENITLAAGGTQKRYRTSGTASDSDDRMDIINTFLASMNGTLRDNGGRLTLTVMKNDLADYVIDFDDNDILDDFSWNQTRGLSETYNIARGRYVDPSDNSLYQMIEYPEVGIASVDGIERVVTIDLPYVEEGRRAQRIAKQVLERNQYRGMFSATFTIKALGCQVGDVVRLSFGPLGWSNKLFRIVSQEIGFDGRVPLTMVEENAAIYAWDADESAPITPVAPTVYNPLNNPFILGIADSATTADWSGIVDDNGNKPEDNATRNISAGTHTTASAYSKGDFVRNSAGDATYIAKQDVPAGIALTNTLYWDLFVQGSGAPGENAISAFLTNASHVIATANDGSGGSYTNAGGTMRVFDGFTEKTTSGTVTFSKVGTGTWYSINSSGVYTITDPGTDSATCQFDASYSGVTVRLTYSIAKSKTGSSGAAGTSAVTGYLTNEAVTLFAYADGTVASYTPAAGEFKIFSGTTDVSSNFALSTQDNPQSLSVSYVGRSYSVGSGFDTSEDTATLTIRATGSGSYTGITIDKVFTLAKAKGGYEIVSSLPGSNLFAGRVVYLNTDGKLYRYTGSAWTASVPTPDLIGQIVNAQIADDAVTFDKIAANSVLASNIVVSNRNDVFPDSGFRDLSYHNLTGANVVAVDGSGSTQPNRFLRVLAGSNDSYTEYVPAEVGGWYRTRLRIYISPDAAGWFGPSVHWPMQAWRNPAPTTDDGSGYPIIDLATTTIPKGSWQSYTGLDQFVANTSYNGMQYRHRWNLTAGYVEFCWEIVRAGSSDLIVDGAITAIKVAANAITADKIEAGAITAAKVGTNEIIAHTANIKDGVISTAKIGDAQISTAKIGDLQVDTIKIANNAVSIPVSAYTAAAATIAMTSPETWTTVQSAVIASSGAPVSCSFSSLANLVPDSGSTISGVPNVRVRRGSTILYQAAYNLKTITITVGELYAHIVQGPDSFTISDTPGAGTFTYYLEYCIVGVGASTIFWPTRTVSNRSIVLLETKK